MIFNQVAEEIVTELQALEIEGFFLAVPRCILNLVPIWDGGGIGEQDQVLHPKRPWESSGGATFASVQRIE